MQNSVITGYKIRVRTGCKTCRQVTPRDSPPLFSKVLTLRHRIRRVKCDETKPNCQRCTKTGRRCDGYGTDHLSRTDLVQAENHRRIPSSTPPSELSSLTHLHIQGHGFNGDGIAGQSFDFFRACIALESCEYFDEGFWSRMVLQMSHSEPAIRHGIMALGTLGRRFRESEIETNKQYYKSALQQYNKAVIHARKLLEGGDNQDWGTMQKILVACIIFVSFENHMGNYAAAQVHLKNGMRILSLYQSRSKAFRIAQPDGKELSSIPLSSCQHPAAEDKITQLFSRFDFQAMTFSDSSSPYQYTPFSFSSPISDASRTSLSSDENPAPLPIIFSSVTEAQIYLFEYIRYLFRLTDALWSLSSSQSPENEHILAIILLMKRKCLLALEQWKVLFDTLLQSQARTRSPSKRTLIPPDINDSSNLRQQHVSGLLRAYYLLSLIILRAGIDSSLDETLWDAQIPLFSDTLDQIESMRPTVNSGQQKIFSLDIGIVLPLFFTAIKCRDPLLRRKAIKLLGALHRREGVWDSEGATKVAEKIMEIEEGDLGIVGQAEDIVETKRVYVNFVTAKLDERKVYLVCMLKPRGREEEWESRDQWVTF
ncbi:MAG: hypothetical protein M1834_008486 [Cirrosporium novae-zelandiae]|nr:MAG: hypothetical protein M1834_008486 [Cirrosporium novae-zelandiae]